jgi:hypothetical protein
VGTQTWASLLFLVDVQKAAKENPVNVEFDFPLDLAKGMVH